MRIRALKLGQLSHPYRHFGNTGVALAEKSIRSRRILPDVLAEAYINGIVVLRHVAVDVIQAAVTDLYVDFSTEDQLQKLHECRYNGCPCAAKADDPACSVPARCPPALILRFIYPFLYEEVPVAKSVRQE